MALTIPLNSVLSKLLSMLSVKSTFMNENRLMFVVQLKKCPHSVCNSLLDYSSVLIVACMAWVLRLHLFLFLSCRENGRVYICVSVYQPRMESQVCKDSSKLGLCSGLCQPIYIGRDLWSILKLLACPCLWLLPGEGAASHLVFLHRVWKCVPRLSSKRVQHRTVTRLV